jgi:hypothetical protein
MGDGNIRNQELRPLGDLALEEYKKGNYVIVGGDWNSVLAALHIDQFPTNDGPSAHFRSLPNGISPQIELGVSIPLDRCIPEDQCR